MVAPTNEAELADVIAASKQAFSIKGGGTRTLGTTMGIPMETQALTGVELYDPGALTVVAKAGTSLDDLHSILAADHQRLAFEPPDLRALLGRDGLSTIGGVVAANASGPRRIQGGACRDYLLGVRFVDGTGRIVKNGGRVMKNVTGYDLVKLMAGSHGTLGVLSEVSLKVLPIPEQVGVLLIEGLRPDQAVSAMSMALGSPFDVTGAAHTTKGLDGDPVTMIRLEGFENSVRYRAEALRDKLIEFGDIHIETDAVKTAAGWAWVRDAAMHVGLPGDVWRISVAPKDGPVVAALLPDTEIQFDWGGGLLWARVPDGFDVRAALTGLKGHATRIKGAGTPQDPSVFAPESAPVAALTAGIRKQFDPKGLLNPGLMGAAPSRKEQ
ncbi:MAG: FAD-binding protein [Pseudoruegeria sp.]